MSFFKNPFKSVKNLFTDPGKFLQNSLPTIGTIAGAYFGGPIGAGIGAGLGETTKDVAEGQSIGSSLKQGALSGIGTYAGSQLGSTIGDTIGGNLGRSVGDVAVSNLPGNAFGSFVGNSIPSALANASIGSVIGGGVGSSVAQNAFHSDRPMPAAPQSIAQAIPTIQPFQAKQEEAQQAPPSLTGLGSLTSGQEATNLANKGVYGGGNGPQEQNYFLNLENRKLVDPQGNQVSLDTLQPIEKSYLQQMGISGYGDTKSLLEAISRWRTSQPAAA